MDLQKIFDNAVQAERQKELASSPQLLIGELILKLETVKDKDKKIEFDYKNYKPICIDSWRGSYRELYISYNKEDGGSYNTNKIKEVYHFDHSEDYLEYEQKSTNLPKNPAVNDLLSMLRECIGKTFAGYKGGNYLMSKNTPIWVSEYGRSGGFSEENTFIINIKETKDKVSLITKNNRS